MSRFSALALLPLVIAACGPKKLPNGASASDYVGVWQDEGGSHTTIEMTPGGLAVTGLVDYDGEVFQIQDYGWDGNFYNWTYFVPSTGYVVNIRVLAATGDTFETIWKNEYDNGSEVYTRIQ